MAVQFAHKPAGSIVGSGSYVFRHYGEETHLITFYLVASESGSTNEQTAPEGKTWRDFWDSGYNTASQIRIFGGYVVHTYTDSYIYSDISCTDDVRVGADDLIVAGATYYYIW